MDGVEEMDGVKVNSGVPVGMAARVSATALARAVWAAAVEATISATRVSTAAVGSWPVPLTDEGPPGKLQAGTRIRKIEAIMARNFFQNMASSVQRKPLHYHHTFFIPIFNPQI
jgi:hypothetical protein